MNYLHADATEDECSFLIFLHLLLVHIVRAFDNWLVWVETVELPEDGINREKELDFAGPS